MKPLILVALVIILAATLNHFASRDFFRELETFTASLGAAGPAVAAMVYTCATVLLIPGSALTLTAAALFGFKTAFVVVFIGANLGSFFAFLMARTFMRERIVRWAATKPQFRSVDRAIERRAFATVLLARLSPALPFNALNYFFGITSVGARVYALATIVGILPGMIAYVYLGAAARDALAPGFNSVVISYQELLKVFGLLATFALVVMIARRARKEFAQIEAEDSDTLPAGSKDHAT
jgi:uncharacterized membrane protein YdjX (TVP38/TMEM64 family)